MNIMLNGQSHHCEDRTRLNQLIESLNLQDQRLAIEVNLEIIPRSQYADYQLQDNDRVEIVHAIGGG